MMKAVLLSVNPLPLEQIAYEIKKLEIRKTKPKLPVPFPVYLYETKGKLQRFSSIGYEHVGRGKVIGEFVCDAIVPISVTYSDPDSRLALRDFPFTCLTDKQIIDYLGNGKTGYGWHISDLKIYETPKELSEFFSVDNEAVKKCENRERIYNNPDFTNGAMLPGSYLCKNKVDWCVKCKRKQIKRPPQSWCYVEELQG